MRERGLGRRGSLSECTGTERRRRRSGSGKCMRDISRRSGRRRRRRYQRGRLLRCRSIIIHCPPSSTNTHAHVQIRIIITLTRNMSRTRGSRMVPQLGFAIPSVGIILSRMVCFWRLGMRVGVRRRGIRVGCMSVSRVRRRRKRRDRRQRRRRCIRRNIHPPLPLPFTVPLTVPLTLISTRRASQSIKVQILSHNTH